MENLFGKQLFLEFFTLGIPHQDFNVKKAFAIIILFVGALIGRQTVSESNKLKELRKERNSLKSKLKTADEEEKPKLRDEIKDLNAQIANKQAKIESLETEKKTTEKELAEAKDKEGILNHVPKRFKPQVKQLFKRLDAFGTNTAKSSRKQYDNLMNSSPMKWLGFTRKRSSSKGKGKSQKTSSGKPNKSASTTAKNK